MPRHPQSPSEPFAAQHGTVPQAHVVNPRVQKPAALAQTASQQAAPGITSS